MADLQDHLRMAEFIAASAAQSGPPRDPAPSNLRFFASAQQPTTTTAHYGLNDLPALRSRIRLHVHEAICSMPQARAGPYLEALAKNPEVVQRETDPMQFVRYENYDVWAGATRLCAYWVERKRVFQERFHLPLVLSGDGALEKEDVMLLQAGYPSLLPGSTPQGQRAVLIDRRKWLPGSSTQSKLRCVFWLFCYLAQDDAAQIEGVLCLLVLVTPRLNELDWPYIHQALPLASRCLPVKIHFHLLNVPQQKKQFLVKDMMQAGFKVMVQYFGTSRLQMHVQREPDQIKDALLALGLSQKSIPLFFGGEWRFEEGFEWLKQREEWEIQAYNLPRPSPVTEMPDSKRRSRESSAVSGEDNDTERRMNDVLLSRRKRERKRQEVQKLKEESSSLIADNRKLKAEQARLENLLAQANGVASTLEQGAASALEFLELGHNVNLAASWGRTGGSG